MIRQLVQAGKLEDAINELASLHQSLGADTNTLTLLKARLADLSERRLKNLVKQEDLTLEMNRITDSFLYFFENLEERVNTVLGLKYDVSDFDQQVRLKMMRQYEVMEQLGEGASAIIYKAREKSSDKVVAIRALKAIRLVSGKKLAEEPDRGDGVGSVKDLNKIASQIKHRNIIEILSRHESDIPFCTVLEYINGVTLDHLLEVGYFPVRDTVSIIRQICDALYYLQNLGYDHKNLRPSKIIIDHELKPVISVFEIFKDLRGFSRIEKILDDLRYSSPEELRQINQPLDYDKVNQFLMGLLMYEMLTGEPLFGGENVEELMENRKRFFGMPNHRRDVFKRTKLPAGLLKVLQRMLEVAPEQRFSNLMELEKELYKLPIYGERDTELVHESYMRCCAKNRDFISSFYQRLFRDFPEKDYRSKFPKGTAHNRTRKKLRVMILQLIDVGNGHAPSELGRIRHYAGHAGLEKEDFANFLFTLRTEVMENDFFWGKDPALGPAWDEMIAKILDKM